MCGGEGGGVDVGRMRTEKRGRIFKYVKILVNLKA